MDVLHEEPVFGGPSLRALLDCIRDGQLVVCEVVLAELSAAFKPQSLLDDRLQTLGIAYLPMTKEAACLAGLQWRAYRDRGGSRTRLIADFMIAVHAKAQCDQLLTRDRGFYRECFGDLRILNPVPL